MFNPVKTKVVQPIRANNHPCQNFIKYLLTLDMFSFKEIENNIVSMGFPGLPIDYIEKLDKSLPVKPTDFDIGNKYHKPTSDYLKSQGIYNLVFKDRYTNEALNYLTHTEIKPFVEKCLLGRVATKEIAKRANSKFGSLLTEQGIERYKHYFWNIDIVKIEDWAKLLSNTSDKQVMLHISRNGPTAAFHHLGFRQQVEIKEVLTEMVEIIYDDMKQLKSKAASPDKIKMMSMLNKMTLDIKKELSTQDKILKDTLEDFKAWRISNTKADVPPIEDIAELRAYTNSGTKLLESGENYDDEFEEGSVYPSEDRVRADKER